VCVLEQSQNTQHHSFNQSHDLTECARLIIGRSWVPIPLGGVKMEPIFGDPGFGPHGRRGDMWETSWERPRYPGISWVLASKTGPVRPVHSMILNVWDLLWQGRCGELCGQTNQAFVSSQLQVAAHVGQPGMWLNILCSTYEMQSNFLRHFSVSAYRVQASQPCKNTERTSDLYTIYREKILQGVCWSYNVILLRPKIYCVWGFMAWKNWILEGVMGMAMVNVCIVAVISFKCHYLLMY
jgi:hypothetical protein